jgi:hypothetical protein
VGLGKNAGSLETGKKDASDRVARRPKLIQFVPGEFVDFFFFSWDKFSATIDSFFAKVYFFEDPVLLGAGIQYIRQQCLS